jgi:RND family efflux transporter MFP subunit
LTTPEPALKEVRKASPRPHPRSPLRALVFFFGILTVLIGAGIFFGMGPRRAREQALYAASKSDGAQLPLVNVVAARPAPAHMELELPGELQAQVESPIFARVDGYLTKRLVDYGDRVRAGQQLAEIETPELDQQIVQAKASLSQSQSMLKQLQANRTLAEANLRLADVTYNRWKHLTDRGVFSKQETDQKEADLGVRKAQLEASEAAIITGSDSIRAAEANLRRLEQMKSFARVTAPFEGVITARNVDIGTLINSGNGGPAREMFRMAQINTLRSFVNVPQANVGAIHDGQSAELRVQELPGQVFQARVDRTTNTVDPTSRSMLTVLQIPNPRGVLKPGMYAQVKFSIDRAAAAVLIPGDTLVVGKQGPRVAVVGTDRHVHYRSIRIGQDSGAEIEVTGGLQSGERVVINPNDSVRENAMVEVHDEGRAGARP